MRVLITGAAGQVGSHLADSLLSLGHTVLGLDNFSTGREIHLPQSENFEFVRGSIANADLIAQAFESFRPDAVAHAAASYKDPDDWEEDLSTNALGAVNLIRESSKHKVKRFVYFQTALVYGLKPLTNPIELDHPKRVDNSSYSISKGVAEDYLALSGLDHVVFRLANVIGDRCVSGPLPIFYQRLVDGKQCFVTPARRDFVYVGDLVKAVIQALGGTGFGAYHFSSGLDFPIRRLYDAVVESLGIEGAPEPELRPISEDEAPSILLNPSRTISDFSISDFTSLEETVSRAVHYYKKFGTSGEYTHLKSGSN